MAHYLEYFLRVKNNKVVEMLEHSGNSPKKFELDLIPVTESEYLIVKAVNGDLVKATNIIFNLRSTVEHWRFIED